MTVDEILEAAKRLTDDERAFVVRALQGDDEAALKAEIRRRVDDALSGKTEFTDVDDIEAHIRALSPRG